MFKDLEAETVCRELCLSLRLLSSGLFRYLQDRRVLKPVALSFCGKVFDGMWFLADNFPCTIVHRWYFSITDAISGQSSYLGFYPSSYLRYRKTKARGGEAEHSLCGEGHPKSVLGSSSFPAVSGEMPEAVLGMLWCLTWGM